MFARFSYFLFYRITRACNDFRTSKSIRIIFKNGRRTSLIRSRTLRAYFNDVYVVYRHSKTRHVYARCANGSDPSQKTFRPLRLPNTRNLGTVIEVSAPPWANISARRKRIERRFGSYADWTMSPANNCSILTDILAPFGARRQIGEG